MPSNHTPPIPKTSRPDEEAHLKDTLAVIERNVRNYGAEVGKMQSEIDEMLEHYHDNDAEVYTLLNNTITLHDHMKRALERNEKALSKPYFGRIVFRDETLGKDESLYIGRGGISIDATHQAVVDWRAPVANAYYENGLGRSSYLAPDGKRIHIDLKLKRTYEIEAGRLLEYFDSEVIANDDLLTKYLAKNKQAVLGEIVATIQKEQNKIIRKSPYHNIIVQGVAGSGKTTVAMHRISYILYNYAERFRPDDFYIVGSNRILLNYITGVLPDLDVHGVRQMTMEQLFVRLLYEDWDEKKYRIRTGLRAGADSAKGTTRWFEDLKAFCDKLEWDAILRDSIYLDRRQFVEGIRNGVAGVYDETNEETLPPEKLILLMDGKAVERYILGNPRVSIQSKINMLNERLLNKVREEFWGKGISYTEAERKAIIKAYRGRYGKRVWKQSIYALYQEFLLHQAAKGIAVTVPDKDFDVYDLAALAYLYKRVKETEVISEAHHIVIDEAQDFGMMAYRVLHFCIQGCTYTVMGDVSQNIRFGYGLNDWEELRALLLYDEMASFGILKKSYRNTVEISQFASRILRHGHFNVYPAEPIIRHGEPVKLQKAEEKEGLFKEAADQCRAWQKKGFETIAVICRDTESAAFASQELGKYIEVMENDPEKATFGAGILVLPVEYTKGLEFDTVLILDPTRTDYPVDDGHAKLLYVAATRALHELCILYQGDLTGLVADPLPEVQPQPDKVEKGGAASRPAGTSAASCPTDAAAPSRAAGARPAAAGTGATSRPAENNTNARAAAGVRPAARPRPGAVLPKATLSQPPVRGIGTRPYSAVGTQATRQSAPNPQSPAASKADAPSFGDLPPTQLLGPAGHSKIDLSVRWAMKQADGLYLPSRYGTLRLCPVGSAILRVTFAKGGQILPGAHPKVALKKADPYWMYKETVGTVELSTDELLVRLDKSDGSLRYLTRGQKPLLAERRKECRQIEDAPGGRKRSRLFLEWVKDEHLYAIGPASQDGLPLRSTARYLSGAEVRLPFLLSDKGYGIVLATDAPAFSCDLPAYGSYLCWEDAPQIDFYFIAGDRQGDILDAYARLCGGRG